MHSPHLTLGGPTPPPPEHKLLGVPLTEVCLFSIYLSTQSFIYISVDLWIFYTLGYNPVLY